MSRPLAASLAALVLIAACSGQGPAPAVSPSGSPTTEPTPSPVAKPTPARTTTPAAVSIICGAFLSAGPIDHLRAAAVGDMTGANTATDVRTAINELAALAASATVASEHNDLSALATAIDTAVMAGGSFSDWDPAYEAFYVKYAQACGQPVAP
jgi:hypothetical protein